MKFEQLIKLANQFNLNPDALLVLFFHIGIVVMNKTSKVLIDEIKHELKKKFPKEYKDLTDQDLLQFRDLFRSLFNV